MSAPIAVSQHRWQPQVEVYDWSRDFITNEKIQVARIEERDGCVTLAARHTEGGPWYPTWLGPKERAVRVPAGFGLPERYAAMIADALLAPVSASSSGQDERDCC